MAVFGLLSLQVLVPRQFALGCHSVTMEWGVKYNHVAVITLPNCRKSYSQIFKLFKPLKISQMFIFWQSNIIRNSGGLKTDFGMPEKSEG
jgi:hypothetical protein